MVSSTSIIIVGLSLIFIILDISEDQTAFDLAHFLQFFEDLRIVKSLAYW